MVKKIQWIIVIGFTMKISSVLKIWNYKVYSPYNIL